MSDTVQFHALPDGKRLAYRLTSPNGDEAIASGLAQSNAPHSNDAQPTIVFLPGYMSDMSGSKASAVYDWAKANGRSCLLFDYSGCGQSSGDFADGTLSRWRDEALDLIAAKLDGPILLIGSSMGGWLMLLIGLALNDRLAGMIGIASAPDFTDWGRNDADKAKLAAGESVFDPNPYGPEPTPMHPGFFADGQSLRLLGDVIAIDCPVHLLHGQRDDDVPFAISMELAAKLRSDAVQITLVKDGDHRLSREQDIALLMDALRRL